VRVGTPPLQVGQQVWGLLRRGPRAACESCHAMPDGHIHPLDEGGVESSRKTQSLQGDFEICFCPQAHHLRDSRQLATPVAFLHLTGDQLSCHLPPAYDLPSATHLKPVSKMGGQRREIGVSTITGEERETAGSQALSQRVDEQMGHVLCWRTELKHGKNLGARINGQPEPQHLCGVAQPGAQFVQLHVWELEVAESVLVQGLSVFESRGTERLVIVACRKPKTRSAAEASSPSASADNTTATCWEGVFRRYKGVWSRALNVVRQA
jgi:hypothetical protein